LLANHTSFTAALEQARREHSWTVISERYIDLYLGKASPGGRAANKNLDH
jgi:hypothetical protein